MGQCNHCDVCGENYDYGERHVCPGPDPAAQPSATTEPHGCGVPLAGKPVSPRRVDKHLEACRRLGQYVQPGYRLGYKR